MGHVDLPPIDALAFRVRIAVVVVVPAFAHGDHGKDEAVFAQVACLKALLAQNVGQRIDAEGAVIKKGRAEKEPPSDHLESVGVKARSVLFKKGAEEKDAY